MKFYEISLQMEALQNALMESDGPLPDEEFERLVALDDMLGEKAGDTYAALKHLKREADAIKAEEDELKAKRKTAERAYDRLREYILENLERLGREVVETPRGKLRVQSASQRSVSVKVDPEDLPERFRRVKVSADSRALKDAIEAGDEEALSVAELNPASKYLRIY